MPSKKKKYNARFPPARIKKIMQTDEEVGKVAAAVPVIISRALELFIDSLIEKTATVTREKNAKTLSASHIKQAIHSEKTFDFLRDLVKNVPDHQAEDDEAGLAPSSSGTQETKPKPVKPRKVKDLSEKTSEKSPAKRGPGRPRKVKTEEKKEIPSTVSDNDSEETDTDEEQIKREPGLETRVPFLSPTHTDSSAESRVIPEPAQPAQQSINPPQTHALLAQQSSQPEDKQTNSSQSFTQPPQTGAVQSNPCITQPPQTHTLPLNPAMAPPSQSSSNIPYMPPNMSHMQHPLHPPQVQPYPMHNMPIPPYPFPVQIPPYNPSQFVPNPALSNSNTNNIMPPMIPPFMPPFMNMPQQGGYLMQPLPPPIPEGGSYLRMLSDAAFRPPVSVTSEQNRAPTREETASNKQCVQPPSSLSADTCMPLDMSLPGKSRSQGSTDHQGQTATVLSNQNDSHTVTTNPPHNMLYPGTHTTQSSQTSVASDQNNSRNGPEINSSKSNSISNNSKKSRELSQSDDKNRSQSVDNRCVPIKKHKMDDKNSIQYENLSSLMNTGPLKMVNNEDDDDYDT